MSRVSNTDFNELKNLLDRTFYELKESGSVSDEQYFALVLQAFDEKPNSSDPKTGKIPINKILDSMGEARTGSQILDVTVNTLKEIEASDEDSGKILFVFDPDKTETGLWRKKT